MTDAIAQSDTEATEAPKPTEQQEAAHRSAEFLQQVDGLLKGTSDHKNHASGAVIEDLRATASDQDELRKQLQKLSESAQKIQGALLQAQGRADALLAVLYRFEGA